MAWWTGSQWSKDWHAQTKPNWEKRWDSYFPHTSVADDTVWFQQTRDVPLKTNWMPTNEDNLQQTRLQDLWAALPTAWRNDLAGWDSEWRDAYLQALSYGKGGVQFEGQVLPGEMVAQKIGEMWAEHRKQRDQVRQGTTPGLDWRIA